MKRKNLTLPVVLIAASLSVAFLSWLLQKAKGKTITPVEMARAIACKDKEAILSRLSWETGRKVTVEWEILAQASYLPDNVRTAWLSTDGDILVRSHEAADENGLYYVEAESEETYSGEGDLTGFDMSLLDSVPDVRDSFLHEMGHFVYSRTYGLDGTYVLPAYETERETYLETDGEGNRYLISTPEE